MGNLRKTHSAGNVISELNRCEAANDTMNSHQSWELIAVLYDLTGGDLNLGLVLKFSWKQILLIPLNGNNMLIPSLKYSFVVMTEKNNILCQDSFAVTIQGRISVELWVSSLPSFFPRHPPPSSPPSLSFPPSLPLFPFLFFVKLLLSVCIYTRTKSVLGVCIFGFWLFVSLFKCLKILFTRTSGRRKCKAHFVLPLLALVLLNLGGCWRKFNPQLADAFMVKSSKLDFGSPASW